MEERAGPGLVGVKYTDGAVVEECYVFHECSPGVQCAHKREFATFCHRVYAPANGFAAVKFDVDLDGKLFYPCPKGT